MKHFGSKIFSHIGAIIGHEMAKRGNQMKEEKTQHLFFSGNLQHITLKQWVWGYLVFGILGCIMYIQYLGLFLFSKLRQNIPNQTNCQQTTFS